MVIFNPLESLSESGAFDADANDLQSTSAIYNEDVGICPKCKRQMEDAVLPINEDTVFFCPHCRVTTPKPDRV